jgi:hypothetical protein
VAYERRYQYLQTYFLGSRLVKFDLINSDIFCDTVIFPDDSNWLESDDIADDNLRNSFRRQEWLDDDEALLSCDDSEAVDSYLSRGHGAGRLPGVREVW